MAQRLGGNGWAQETLYEGIFELNEEIIVAGSDMDESPLTKASRRRKREAIGKRYLQGYIPFIQSAQLLGPFDLNSGWVNPWGDLRTHKIHQPHQKPVTKTIHTTMDKADRIMDWNTSQIATSWSADALPWVHYKDDVDQFDADDEIDEVDNNEDQSTIKESLGVINDYGGKPQESRQTFNRMNQREESNADIVLKQAFSRGTKRKSESTEGWLKVAHMSKRFRPKSPHYTTPTPAAGAKRRQSEKSINLTTPAQSTLQSPRTKSEARDVSCLPQEGIQESSGFTPIKSSGQPTPPSEPRSSAQSYQSHHLSAGSDDDEDIYGVDKEQRPPNMSTGYDLNEKSDSKTPIDSYLDLREDHLNSPTPKGSFKYRKMRRVQMGTKQDAFIRGEDSMVCKTRYLATITDLSEKIVTESDQASEMNDLQKRLMYFSSKESPGAPNDACEGRNMMQESSNDGTDFLNNSIANAEEVLKLPKLRQSNSSGGVSKDALQTEVHNSNHSNEQGADSDFSDLLEDALHEQLFSEAFGTQMEAPKRASTPADVDDLASFWNHTAELTRDLESISSPESHKIQITDYMDNIELGDSSHNSRQGVLYSEPFHNLKPQIVPESLAILRDDESPQSNDHSTDDEITGKLDEQQHGPSASLNSAQSSNRSPLPEIPTYYNNIQDDKLSPIKIPQQSPWVILEKVGPVIKSLSPDITRDEGSSQVDISTANNKSKSRDTELDQSPWMLTSPPLVVQRHSVDTSSQDGKQIDFTSHLLAPELSAVHCELMDDKESSISPEHQNQAASFVGPFTSTQSLVNAATVNPWTGSGKNETSRRSKKRVSWLPLSSEDLDDERTLHSSKSFQNILSPPPPPGSLAFIDPKVPFQQVFNAAEKLNQVQKTPKHRMQSYSTSSPAIDAMAEAFIAADRNSPQEKESGQSSRNAKGSRQRLSNMESSSMSRLNERKSQDASQLLPTTSFSISPNGEITAVGTGRDTLDDDEELGAVIEDIGSFLEGWDVDTELKKASAQRTDKRGSGHNWRDEDYMMGI